MVHVTARHAAAGLELAPLLRARGQAVMIVSAREATAEKLAALDLAADDHVTRPFDSEELQARIRTETGTGHRLSTA